MRECLVGEDGPNHEHVGLILDICFERLYVAVRCLACDGQVDGFEFLGGSAVVDRDLLLAAAAAHEDYCPARAIIEEADDDEEEQ